MATGFTFTSAFAREALQWLWSYTVEFEPARLWRPAAWRTLASERSERRWRLVSGVASRAAASSSTTRKQHTISTAPITQFESPLHNALDAIAANAPHARRAVQQLLNVARGSPEAAELGAALAAPTRDVPELLAQHIQALVMADRPREALAPLRSLLHAHEAVLLAAQKRALGGQHTYVRGHAGLAAVNTAATAVFSALSARDAPTVAAWLWTNPLALALVQPPFPRVIRAVYTLLASLPSPRVHVAEVLRAPRPIEARTRHAGVVALALANRGAPDVAAQIISDMRAAQLTPHEAVVRRVLRLLSSPAARVHAAPLAAWLESHGRSRSTLRLLVSYYAGLGDTAAMERCAARLPSDGDAGVAALRAHAALTCAAARGDVPAVRAVTGTMPTTEPHTFALVRALVRANDASAAWTVFTHVGATCASERVHGDMAALAARWGDADEALRLAAQLQGAGLAMSASTLARIVAALGAARVPERAAALVAQYAARGVADRRVYTALMDAYVRAGHWPAVHGIYRWMSAQRDVARRPDTPACNTLLKSLVRRGAPVPVVLQFMLDMRQAGRVPDAHTYALVVQSACDARRVALAEELFALADEALRPSHGGATLALYTSLLCAHLREGNTVRARELFEALRKHGVEPGRVTYAVLVQHYAADTEESLDVAGELAFEVLEAPRAPGAWRVPVTNEGPMFEDLLVPLIDAHGKRGDVGVAVSLFHRLLQTSQRPSPRALTVLMNAYRYAGDVDNALRLYDEIYEAVATRALTTASAADALVAPMPGTASTLGPFQRNLLCLPLSIAIDTASRAGLHDRVAELWTRARRDGFAFDATNWNHLCAALARAGRVRDALQLVETVLREPPPAEADDAGAAELAAQAQAAEDAYAADPLHVHDSKRESEDVPRTDAPQHPPARRTQHRDGAADATAAIDTLFDATSPPTPVAPRRQWFATFETLKMLNEALGKRDALLAPFPTAAARLATHRRRFSGSL